MEIKESNYIDIWAKDGLLFCTCCGWTGPIEFQIDAMVLEGRDPECPICAGKGKD